MRLLAIDPGPEQSAWLVWLEDAVEDMGIEPNDSLLAKVRRGCFANCQAVAIEKVASFGMPVGAEVFETVFASGRFAEACRGIPLYRPSRMSIKMHLCHSARANDATIRQALIDRFGGKEHAIGRKAAPGPLYGVHADLWSALAVAVTIAAVRNHEVYIAELEEAIRLLEERSRRDSVME
jgi:hypothetical protein